MRYVDGQWVSEGKPNDIEENQTIKSIDDVFSFKRLTVDSCFIVGAPGSGKSVLAKYLVSQMETNWRIRCFDSSGEWDSCSLKWRFEASNKDLALPCFPNINLVYDLGDLYVDQMIVQIQDLIRREWELNYQLYKQGKERKQHVYVFEEAQDYFEPSILRSKKGREFKRLVCKGRNNLMRFVALTQKPQLVDCTLWELCGQILFGKFQRTDYIQNVLGDRAEETRDLSVGEWLYYCDGNIQKVKSENYKCEQTKVINRVLEGK